MKTAFLLLLVVLNYILGSYALDPYLCIPNADMPTIAKEKKHRLYRIPTPFPVSYGGYVPDYPECSLEGVIAAIDLGYKGVQVTAAYLRSQEVAMIANPTLFDYVGGDEFTNAYQVTGNQFAKKVFKKSIIYGDYEYEYTGVYRAAFLYEIFDAIPNFKDGVFFISVIPELPATLNSEEKILTRLTMRWIKYVIDSFQAWDRAILYDVDAIKALDFMNENGCNHLYGFEAYYVLYLYGLGSDEVKFSHAAIPKVRDCASSFDDAPDYTDFLLTSGSIERHTCISLTIAEMETFYYKTYESKNPGNLTSIALSTYYKDASSYYVGLFTDPYMISYYKGGTEKLNDLIMRYVSTYDLQFFITPAEYYYYF